MDKIIDAMNWRYATKKFDTSKKLSDDQLHTLLEAMRLAPASYGLQPFTYVVVTNPEVREKLVAAGYNQAQIAESSHLIVFSVAKNIDDMMVDTFIKSVADTRGMKVEDLKGYEDMIKGTVNSMTSEQRVNWATRQIYIALGVLITTAAISGIDVGPMEGFNAKKFDEILGLEEKGLESKVIAAVGFRGEGDPYETMAKVRRSMDDMFVMVD